MSVRLGHHLLVLVSALAGMAVLSFAVTAQGQQTPAQSYTPGLGELMTLTQMRHSKLWLAGSNDNWALAAYEADELKEGLEDAAKYVPVYKGTPIAGMIEGGILPQIRDMEAAIESKDRVKFEATFDALTSACNACHQSSNRGYIVMQRPATSAFPNQSFAPPRN